MNSFEVNFDGLVGPTHNYAGLSLGNVASSINAGVISHPKAAAKQGLAKSLALRNLGLKQGILPPHERPHLPTLRRLGFTGSDEQILAKAYKKAPALLSACYSASPMWTANAATVSPSADTQDHLVHFTPANLNSKFHRSIEPQTTGKILQKIFSAEKYFQHHRHLPAGSDFADEGAANHTRFCQQYGAVGVEFFVFGRYAMEYGRPAPVKFPARQTYEASMAIARLHGLDPAKTVFAQQNPATIDAGVFHNDVISVGNKNVYFFHEQALLDSKKVLAEIKQKFGAGAFFAIEVPQQQVSVQDAVASYLFNSQLISLEQDKMAIVVPQECRQKKNVWDYLQYLITLDNPIKEVQVFDVKESMKNGGGPACLRLRVVLTAQEYQNINPAVLLTDQLYTTLNAWIDKYYREQIAPQDLADPQLWRESRQALDELTQILKLGAIYSFQN